MMLRILLLYLHTVIPYYTSYLKKHFSLSDLGPNHLLLLMLDFHQDIINRVIAYGRYLNGTFS